ncbi:hypothetical protein BV25DRAFT_1652190 [Artomyces pyxidatus]|uniref:Uncharacterized protein n=1 Tax=Artomyces pyxidatus TaxID=48021 RepID=A0ACB8SI38_9AGAM|nr:hypothetical protein BV25DRAFT_1652190 [Artomyces pyxidatus]
MTTSTAPGLSASLSAEADLLRLQKSDQQQTSGTFGGESDPASSLRQAALKTLRSKRRKPVTGSDISSALPVRPTAVVDSVQLDYGQEEPTPALPPPSAPEPVSAVASVPASKVDAAASSLDNDATTREEGEISENEDPPPPKPAPKPTPPAKIPAKIFPKPASPPASRSVASASASVAKPPIPPPTKVEPLAPPPPVTPTSSKLSSQRSSLGDPMVPLTPLTGSTDNFRLEHSSYIIDAAHVRPGLTLSQEQYNAAKDIVLDLLGWGVPPEYLVDCGLSREIVYYVFTELNLRLPSNLDTTGIPPFPPTDKLAALLGAADLSFQKTPVQPVPGNNYAPRNSISHPSLPPRPIAPQGVAKAPRPSSTALNSLSASAPAFVPRPAPSSPDTHVPSTVVMSPEDSLAAMEQQKRQELLARKAVQASRRRKDSSMATSFSGDGSSPEKPVAVSSETRPKPVVPQASVDDFLKTIDPTNGSIARARRASSPEPMQVDEDIPGLGGSFSEYRPVSRPSMHAPPPPLPPPDRLPSPSMLDSVDFSNDGDSPEERRMVERALGLDETPPKESASSSSSAPISAVPSARSSTTPQPTAPIPRRGMKRPVAADFVDIDSGPATNPYAIVAPSRTGSIGNGYTHGGPTSHPNPHVRRKMNAAAAGGFASVSNMRRCVIDLSDSEDGGDDDEEEMPPTPAPEPTEAAKLELEIERMRRKIREREEQQRQKMIAVGCGFCGCGMLLSDVDGQASSGRATPTLPSTPVLAAAQPAVSGKQESVDAAGSAERTTPQSAARGVAENGKWQASVMGALFSSFVSAL